MPEQLHPPPVASVHVAVEYPPRAAIALPTPEHVTGVDDRTRQPGANWNSTLPDVVVPSVYVPSALAVHVPVTCRDPLTGADAQAKPFDSEIQGAGDREARGRHGPRTRKAAAAGAALEHAAPALPELLAPRDEVAPTDDPLDEL